MNNMKFVFEILGIMYTLKWTTVLIHCMRFFWQKQCNRDLHRLSSSFSMAWKELLSEGPCSPIVHNRPKLRFWIHLGDGGRKTLIWPL